MKDASGGEVGSVGWRVSEYRGDGEAGEGGKMPGCSSLLAETIQGEVAKSRPARSGASCAQV